jgi:hypothetical protein
LLILPSLFLPPLECCFGTIPIQAEKLRPDRKDFGSATVAITAVASTGPMPGASSSLMLISLERCQAYLGVSILFGEEKSVPTVTSMLLILDISSMEKNAARQAAIQTLRDQADDRRVVQQHFSSPIRKPRHPNHSEAEAQLHVDRGAGSSREIAFISNACSGRRLARAARSTRSVIRVRYCYFGFGVVVDVGEP